jgi:hypothetical protein
VQLYRYFVRQSSEFCRHNPLCCFSTSVYCCLFRCRLSPETFGYTHVLKSALRLSNQSCITSYVQIILHLNIMYTCLLHGAGYYLKSWSSLSSSKKNPVFLRNPMVHHRVHKSPPLDPILSQPNPVHPIDPYLPKVHFNVILPPTPRSSQWSLAFGPPNQNSVNTSPLPMRATC